MKWHALSLRSYSSWPQYRQDSTCRCGPVVLQRMSYKIAKLILEHAGTFVERQEAIRTAMNMGMPLHEIEAYLDWLDIIQVREEPQAKDNDTGRH